MKRKIIQIAKSTKMISLPHQWCKKHDVTKGEEIDLEEMEEKIIITPTRGERKECANIDIGNMKKMSVRAIHSMYKRGVDELRVSFKNTNTIRTIQSAIGKEAMSFEIVEQGKNHCVIKSIAENLEEFDSILRRTFLLIMNMAEEMEITIKDKNFKRLKEIVFLEETNNRYTTFCRRLLNKRGNKDYKKIGPIYYIVEELENIADYYKFICKSYLKTEGKIVVDKNAFNLFKRVNTYFRSFYDLFYKFNNTDLEKIYEKRKDIIRESMSILKECEDKKSLMLAYNSWTIMQHIFCMVGPLMVLKAGE